MKVRRRYGRGKIYVNKKIFVEIWFWYNCNEVKYKVNIKGIKYMIIVIKEVFCYY